MKKKFKLTANITIITFLLVFTVSCVPVKKLKYFTDIDEMQEPLVNPKGPRLIMPFDKIYIQVLSIDEKTNLLFNANVSSLGTNTTNIIGYFVDDKGNVNYPFVGNINVGGLTTAQASLKFEKALSEYVSNNAAVSIKFIDNNVTVMGEVKNQGVHPFSQEKLNVYEALALGGGLTSYGDRKNVILIRQVGDKIMHYKLDLSNSRIAGKDNYYILANDVIIVEPLRNISTNYGNNTYSLFLSSITTLIALMLLLGVHF